MKYGKMLPNSLEKALIDKDPPFCIQIEPVRPFNIFVECEGKQSMTKTFDGKGNASFKINEFVDIHKVRKNSTVCSVWIGADGINGDSVEFPYPFWGTKTITLTKANGYKEGDYKLIFQKA